MVMEPFEFSSGNGLMWPHVRLWLDCGLLLSWEPQFKRQEGKCADRESTPKALVAKPTPTPHSIDNSLSLFGVIIQRLVKAFIKSTASLPNVLNKKNVISGLWQIKARQHCFVPNDAKTVEVASTTSGAEGLLKANHHVANVLAIPQGVENHVGKSTTRGIAATRRLEVPVYHGLTSSR